MLRNLSRTKFPFTPVRRLFTDALRQPPALGKRVRDPREDDFLDGLPPCPSPGFQKDSPLRANKYSIALLNEVAGDDAVVVSALDIAPFCCHADLCMMPRDALEGVARALNNRLPAALQIDLSPGRQDTYIRNAIELLVGLRTAGTLTPPPTPPLPRRAQVPLEPVSPLARRSRLRSSGTPLGTPLRAVREEPLQASSGRDVRMADTVPPPSKKRKSEAVDEHEFFRAPPPLRRSLTSAGRDESEPPIAKRVRRTLSLGPAKEKTSGTGGVVRQRKQYRPRGGVGHKTTLKEKAAAEKAADELASVLGGLSLSPSRSAMDISP